MHAQGQPLTRSLSILFLLLSFSVFGGFDNLNLAYFIIHLIKVRNSLSDKTRVEAMLLRCYLRREAPQWRLNSVSLSHWFYFSRSTLTIWSFFFKKGLNWTCSFLEDSNVRQKHYRCSHFHSCLRSIFHPRSEEESTSKIVRYLEHERTSFLIDRLYTGPFYFFFPDRLYIDRWSG